MRSIVFGLERIEARWRAGAQHVVAPADRADEQLAAAILVEEDDPGIKLARLREQEVERNRLARPRRPDDREVAKIALVAVEEVWPRGGRLEQDRKGVG